MTTPTLLNWAVLGTGVIANEMASALAGMGRSLYGVCNRTYEKASVFAEKYGVKQVYPTYDALFSDPNVDVIYITTPHNTHYSFIKTALEHKKHVLAEKSITLNSRELEELTALAREKNLVFAEAMTIWHMPLYKKLWELTEGGNLGRVQMITANFGSFKDYDMKNRFFNRSLAGGALLGAIFMATDYSTSPMTVRGSVIFGVGIGAITMCIRLWGAYPEGMSFAILIMNAVVPLINKYVKPKRFGVK